MRVVRFLMIVTALVLAASAAQAAELVQSPVDEQGVARSFNWQDREYFGTAYTERQIGGGNGEGSAADGGASSAGPGGGSCSK